MENQGKEKLMEDLALALIYLSSWTEENKEVKAWKSYDFDALDKLKEEEMVTFSYSTKMLNITTKGIKKAKQLVEKLSNVPVLSVS